MTRAEIQLLIEIFDAASECKREIENKIFDIESKSSSSRAALLRRYLRCQRRCEMAAINVAKAFLDLNRSDKEWVVSCWAASYGKGKGVHNPLRRGCALTIK